MSDFINDKHQLLNDGSRFISDAEFSVKESLEKKLNLQEVEQEPDILKKAALLLKKIIKLFE